MRALSGPTRQQRGWDEGNTRVSEEAGLDAAGLVWAGATVGSSGVKGPILTPGPAATVSLNRLCGLPGPPPVLSVFGSSPQVEVRFDRLGSQDISRILGRHHVLTGLENHPLGPVRRVDTAERSVRKKVRNPATLQPSASVNPYSSSPPITHTHTHSERRRQKKSARRSHPSLDGCLS